MTVMQNTAARQLFASVTRYDVGPAEPALEPWPAFAPEDILEGDPAHKGAVLYRDPTRLFSLGIWECPPCKFQVAYVGTESGHVVKGSATLTDTKTGLSQTVKAGDRFLVPFGSAVVWQVHETFRKVYTMYESEWIDERFY